MQQIKFLLIATFFFCSLGSYAQQAEIAIVPPPPVPELPAPPPPPPPPVKPAPPMIMTPSKTIKQHHLKDKERIESKAPEKPIPPVLPVDLPPLPKD